MGKQGKGTPPKTEQEGAMVPVRLAVGDLGPGGDENGGFGNDSEKLNGRFFNNSSIIAPGWGKANSWLDM